MCSISKLTVESESSSGRDEADMAWSPTNRVMSVDKVDGSDRDKGYNDVMQLTISSYLPICQHKVPSLPLVRLRLAWN